MLADRSFYLLIVAILVLTACAPQFEATSTPAVASLQRSSRMNLSRSAWLSQMRQDGFPWDQM
ncbi:MAG TPA: hypothetical protein VK897_11245 [Anaerolineales bacterium]|nr:hypothetical protein [Anaerolineales bacterium]